MNNLAVPDGVSILLIKTSSVGDIIHAWPVLRALKKNGAVRVDWVVNRQYKELARLSPHVDQIIPFNRQEIGDFWRSRNSFSALRGFIRRVREREYDVAIDLQGLLRSAIITRAARTKRTIGFADAREGARFLYHSAVPTEVDSHAVTKNLRILSAIGIDTDETDCDLAIPDNALAKAMEMTGPEPYFVINPNARWKSKRWPVERFAMVAESVSRTHNLRPVIIGGPDEKERGAELAALIDISKTLDLSGKTDFATLAAILKRATVTLTNDSGPMHLAAALDSPVVALYGPTDPQKVGPCGTGHRVVTASLDCAPCRNRSCEINPSCMEAIDVEQVVDATNQQFLAGTSR